MVGDFVGSGKQQRIRIKGPVDTSVLHLLDRSRRDAARHWEDVRRYPPKSSIPSCFAGCDLEGSMKRHGLLVAFWSMC